MRRRDGDAAMGVAAPARRQRVGDVGEVGVRVRVEEVGEPVGEVADDVGRAGRQGEDLLALRRRRGRSAGRLLDDDVGVRAADAERAHAGAAADGRPATASRVVEITNGVRSRSSSGLGAVWLASGGSVRWRSACTTLITLATPAAVSRWPMLGFVETSRQNPCLGRRVAERLGQRGDLDRVADGGAGAVGLEELDVAGRQPGDRQRLLDDVGVAVDARREVADLALAVVVDRRALDDREDRVAVVRARRRAGAARRRRRRSSAPCRPSAASNARQTPSGDRISPSRYV